MVDKTLKTSSPAQRNVSFQANESDTYTEDEKLIFAKIREVVGLEHDEARIWREIRLHVQGDNEDRAANVINLMIDSAPQHHHSQQQADVLKDLPSSTTIEKSNENNLETNAQTSEPMEVDSFAVAPYYGPHEASTSTHTSTHDREESDLQKALKESLKVSNNLSSYEQSLPSDLETVVRNADSSTGLFNAGNTCWFNCVAQILYHLPMFRKIIYNSVPDEWERVDESKTKPETVTVKDFVIVLRKLFAEMYFSTVSYIDPTEVLQVVDALTRRCSSSPDTSVLGQQQDATESLIRIMEWLEKGIREGLKEMRDPKEKPIEQVEEASYIPENSTSVAPNSDVVGTAPPVYTEEVKPELGSLSNVPIKDQNRAELLSQSMRKRIYDERVCDTAGTQPCDIRNQFQEKMRKTVGEELTEAGNAKKLDLSIERVGLGEMNDKDRRGQYVSPKPPLAKRERMEEPMKLGEANSDSTAAKMEPDQHEDQNVQVADGAHVRTDGDQPDKQDYELLEQRLDDLFAATFCTVTHNESSWKRSCCYGKRNRQPWNVHVT